MPVKILLTELLVAVVQGIFFHHVISMIVIPKPCAATLITFVLAVANTRPVSTHVSLPLFISPLHHFLVYDRSVTVCGAVHAAGGVCRMSGLCGMSAMSGMRGVCGMSGVCG